MIPQFTEPVEQALHSALTLARSSHHTEICELHLLHALYEDQNGYFSAITSTVQIDPKRVYQLVTEALKHLPTYEGSIQEPKISLSLQKNLMQASQLAKSWNDTFVASDHIFMTFLQEMIEPLSSLRKEKHISLDTIQFV